MHHSLLPMNSDYLLPPYSLLFPSIVRTLPIPNSPPPPYKLPNFPPPSYDMPHLPNPSYNSHNFPPPVD